MRFYTPLCCTLHRFLMSPTPRCILLPLQSLLFLRCLLTLPSLLQPLRLRLLLMLPKQVARQRLDVWQGCDDFANTHPVFSGSNRVSFTSAIYSASTLVHDSTEPEPYCSSANCRTTPSCSA